ncbi:hypothetical protein ACLK19_13395 [Escherichia coli]
MLVVVTYPGVDQTTGQQKQNARRRIFVEFQPIASVRHSTDKNGQLLVSWKWLAMQLEFSMMGVCGTVEALRNNIREGKVEER